MSLISYKNLQKETPEFAKKILNILLYLSGVWELVIMPNLHLTEHLTGIISHWIVMSLAFMRFTINFFHWETKPKEDTNK